MIIHNLKVLLHNTFLKNPALPEEYGVTTHDIAEVATPDTWETLKGMYSLEGHKHFKGNEYLVSLLATHEDPAIRLAVALNPSFAHHASTGDEYPLIGRLAQLHADGHSMIPKVHAFLGLTKSFPRRGKRRAEPESVPEQKRAYELSDQQKDIIQHEPTSPIVVAAAAGSGKTSTLVEYAQAWPDHTFLYLAFNAAIKKEAERVMPRNVTVMTTHGLAYRSLDIRRIARDNLKSNLYRNDIRQAATRISYENS